MANIGPGRIGGGEGYGIAIAPLGMHEEHKWFTCQHCNHAHRVEAMCRPEDAGGLCKICMKLICPSCVGKPCYPFEKRITDYENRQYAMRDYGLAE